MERMAYAGMFGTGKALAGAATDELVRRASGRLRQSTRAAAVRARSAARRTRRAGVRRHPCSRRGQPCCRRGSPGPRREHPGHHHRHAERSRRVDRGEVQRRSGPATSTRWSRSPLQWPTRTLPHSPPRVRGWTSFPGQLGDVLPAVSNGAVSAKTVIDALHEHDQQLLQQVTSYAAGDYATSHEIAYDGLRAHARHRGNPRRRARGPGRRRFAAGWGRDRGRVARAPVSLASCDASWHRQGQRCSPSRVRCWPGCGIGVAPEAGLTAQHRDRVRRRPNPDPTVRVPCRGSEVPVHPCSCRRRRCRCDCASRRCRSTPASSICARTAWGDRRAEALAASGLVRRTARDPASLARPCFSGHVDSPRGPAVFAALSTVRRGARVLLDRADGSTVAFRVTRVELHKRARFPKVRVYWPTLQRELRLITCGGQYVRSRGGYQSNVVVFATAEPTAGVGSLTVIPFAARRGVLPRGRTAG